MNMPTNIENIAPTMKAIAKYFGLEVLINVNRYENVFYKSFSFFGPRVDFEKLFHSNIEEIGMEFQPNHELTFADYETSYYLDSDEIALIGDEIDTGIVAELLYNNSNAFADWINDNNDDLFIARANSYDRDGYTIVKRYNSFDLIAKNNKIGEIVPDDNRFEIDWALIALGTDPIRDGWDSGTGEPLPRL